MRRVTVGSGMEDGKSLADNGSDSLFQSTERAAVVTATASVVRRRSSTDQTERHLLRARRQLRTRRHVPLQAHLPSLRRHPTFVHQKTSSMTYLTNYFWLVHIADTRTRCKLLLQCSLQMSWRSAVCPSVCVCHDREPCKTAVLMAVRTGAIWQIRLNDPCSAAIHAVATIIAGACLLTCEQWDTYSANSYCERLSFCQTRCINMLAHDIVLFLICFRCTFIYCIATMASDVVFVQASFYMCVFEHVRQWDIFGFKTFTSNTV